MRNEEPTLDRRAALNCLGWLGAGTYFTLSGGLPGGVTLDRALAAPAPGKGMIRPLSFVQISDTHVGFSKPANPDPVATLRDTVERIRALPRQPDFIVHTGDVTHLASPAQFDLARQLLSQLPAPVLFIPGEHDMVDGTDPRPFNAIFGEDTKGDGWFSHDIGGLHVVGLVNVVRLGVQGQGTLGRDQLDWLKADLAGRSSSTPIVVLSHFPLWSLYPAWGWGTADAAEAFAVLARFASVTALCGHIHQIQRNLEGKVQFHSARSTAYPQPAPGVGPGPGPLMVPAGQLHAAIGYSAVEATVVDAPVAVTDFTLG